MKLLLALVCFVVVHAHAQIIVSFSGGDDLSVGPGTAGYDFTVTQSYTVNSLGVWDSSGSGLSSSHAIGIWDAGTRSLLDSAIVAPSSEISLNGFLYATTAPFTFQPGTTYRLGAQYQDIDFDQARGNATSVTVAHGMLGDAYLSSGSGFDFPDVNVAGANAGFFGPNAAFIAIPEPSRLSLVVGCLLLVVCLLRRQKDALSEETPSSRRTPWKIKLVQ